METIEIMERPIHPNPMELDRVLDEIKSTADRFTIYYPDVKLKHIRTLLKPLQKKNPENMNTFVLSEKWTDFENGLKGRVLKEFSTNRRVVTLWIAYKHISCPTHLHLEDKSIYVVAGSIKDPVTGETIAERDEVVSIPAQKFHKLKITAGTLFIATFNKEHLK